MKPNDEQWDMAFPPKPPAQLTLGEVLTALCILATLVICIVSFLGPILNGG